MCNVFWRFLLEQPMQSLWNSVVYNPWKYCSGNRNPCTSWCLCCNRWLCWGGLIGVATVVIVFWIFFNLFVLAMLGVCETYCVITAMLGNGSNRCFDYAVRPPPPPPPPPNQRPIASTNGPYFGRPGQPIPMSAAGSTDPENAVLSASWDLGDGTVLTGMAVAHGYANTGTFPVTVTVSDGALSDSASTTATIIFIGGSDTDTAPM